MHIRIAGKSVISVRAKRIVQGVESWMQVRVQIRQKWRLNSSRARREQKADHELPPSTSVGHTRLATERGVSGFKERTQRLPARWPREIAGHRPDRRGTICRGARLILSTSASRCSLRAPRRSLASSHAARPGRMSGAIAEDRPLRATATLSAFANTPKLFLLRPGG